jgi:hypothetical protein
MTTKTTTKTTAKMTAKTKKIPITKAGKMRATKMKKKEAS